MCAYNTEITQRDLDHATVALQPRDPRWSAQRGKIGWALLWLLGVPLPVLLIIYLIRGH